MKTLSQLAVLMSALACGPAWASSHAGNQAPKKPAAKKEAPGRSTGTSAKTPDLANMEATPYDCDLGDKLTVYRKANDDQEIALQWNKRTHQMKRMQTSTGADRFESVDSGWVWIGIPSKGILLDSKKGRQLANECRSEEQKKLMMQK